MELSGYASMTATRAPTPRRTAAPILFYHGHFTRNTVMETLATMASRLSAQECRLPMMRKLFHVTTECMQNIRKHAEPFRHAKARQQDPALLVNREGDTYQVISRNGVANSRVAFLTDRLERINSLNRQELNEWYRHILKTSPSSGGAGLGLVDIARKSGQKLLFEFTQGGENFCFFILKVTLCGKEQD